MPPCTFTEQLFSDSQLRDHFFSPLPQDKILHRCQLEGRGLHMQWCSRVAFPVRRCAQVTCRDWKPCRPQVAVHCVHGPTRQWRAQASVEQFFRELGLQIKRWVSDRNTVNHSISTVDILMSMYNKKYSTFILWCPYLPLESSAHSVGDFGGICVLAVNMAVLCGQTGTHTLTMTLKEEISSNYKQVQPLVWKYFCTLLCFWHFQAYLLSQNFKF